MIYCDKCRNHIAQRHVNGRNNDMSFGPFSIDLCTRCYNDFRKLVSNWTKNDTWSEVDAQAHSNENNAVWSK